MMTKSVMMNGDDNDDDDYDDAGDDADVCVYAWLELGDSLLNICYSLARQICVAPHGAFLES